MTAAIRARRAAEARRRHIPLAPAEGWLTVAAALFLVLPVAWSFGEAAWVPGSPSELDYLPWVALGGLAWGTLGAKLGRRRWVVHVTGAVIGALVALVIGGTFAYGVTHPGADPFDVTTIPARLTAIGLASVKVWQDLAVEGQPFTTVTAHYHLWFAGVVWGTAQAAGYSVFGHRRPVDAIVVSGLMLLADMAATRHEQIPFLIVFSLAALVLLVRTHAFDERASWVRRRIGDPSAVSSLYLRGGTTFIASAVVVALVLTGTASSAPLQGLWNDLPARLAGLAQVLQRIGPGGGEFRTPNGVTFQSDTTTTGFFDAGSGVAFRADVAGLSSTTFKWRVGTYATYTRYGWQWGPTESVSHNPGAPLLQGSLDDPAALIGRRQVTVGITPDAFREGFIVSPMTLQSVDRAATARFSAAGGAFTAAEIDGDGGQSYRVTALIPVLGDVPGGITANRLRAAGRTYPAAIASRYLALPDGALGPASQALLDRIVASLPPDTSPAASADRGLNPYDLAHAVEAFLGSSGYFGYDSDVQAQTRARCAGLSTVECFAIIRAGYCEHFATMMTVFLRAEGVPARIAYGFLAGTRDGSTESVDVSLRHWWVEAFFPGYGWIEFDPTAKVGQPVALPAGSVVTGTPTPRPTIKDETDQPGTPKANGGGGTTTPQTPGPFMGIAIVLLLVLAAAVVAVRRRTGPGPVMDPDHAWGALGRWARRAGLRPRPAQTVYEFAGTLVEAIPTASVDLSTVARAKVEVAYGRRTLEEDRLRAIGSAYRRIRVSLLRFALRPRRPGRRR